MPADVRPYFVPALETISWEPWMLFDGSAWADLPDELDGWDSGTDLRLSRRVRVDSMRLHQETGLRLAELAVTLSWKSSTTTMTDAAASVAFNLDGAAIVQALLPGDRLSGTLELRTTLCLIRAPAVAQAGVASIPGSILAEDSCPLTLETRSSMFPVHDIDFAGTRLSPTASWHLETTTELDAPFYGTFRVLVNRRDKELTSAVTRGGAKDKRQQALLDELEGGVAALLLELALNLRVELDERDVWPVDSTGDVLSRLLDSTDMTAAIPVGSHELSDFRTQLAGAVRHAGKGRIFE